MEKCLVLNDVKFTGDNFVFENGARGDVDTSAMVGDDDDSALESDFSAEVNVTGDGELVEFEKIGNGGKSVVVGRDVFEVRAKLDDGSRAEVTERVHDESAVHEGVEVGLNGEKIGSGFDRKEAISGYVNAMCVFEELNGSASSGFELDDVFASDGFRVANDIHVFQHS